MKSIDQVLSQLKTFPKTLAKLITSGRNLKKTLALGAPNS